MQTPQYETHRGVPYVRHVYGLGKVWPLVAPSRIVNFEEDDAPSTSRVAEARGHAPRARVARVMPLVAGPHRLGLQHGDERWESV